MREVVYLWGDNWFDFWKLESIKQSTQCPKEFSVYAQLFENRAPICIWKAFLLSAVNTCNLLLFALKGEVWMLEFIEYIKICSQKSFTWIYYIFLSLHTIIFQFYIHSWLLTFIEGMKRPLDWAGKHELNILPYTKRVLLWTDPFLPYLTSLISPTSITSGNYSFLLSFSNLSLYSYLIKSLSVCLHCLFLMSIGVLIFL